MGMKADQFEVEMDKQGQNTVVGDQLMKYFRVDHCIYLTRHMFDFLGKLATSLTSQIINESLSEYSLASLSAVIRLIQINLRCMTACKVSLEDICISMDQSAFKDVRGTFDGKFGPNLRKVAANWLQQQEVAEIANTAPEEEKKSEATETTEANEASQSKESGQTKDEDEAKLVEEAVKAADAAEAAAAKAKKRKEDVKLYVDIVIEQARDLETVLNKLFHSTNPSSRMQEMAENLKKAQEASIEEKQTALHTCFLTFDALSNNTSMREILRTCKVD